jgi:hypothetical protein
MAKRGEIDIEGTGAASHEDPKAGKTSPAPDRPPPGNQQEPSREKTAAENEAHPDTDCYGSYRYELPPRRPRSERENAFNAAAWLLEGALGIGEELRHNDLGLSEEFWIHAYAARREFLLSLRELVNCAIERCDREERLRTERQKRQQRRGRVQID